MKRPFILFITIFFLFFVFFLDSVQAEVIVSPSIINQKVKARDFLDFTVTVTNQGSSMIWLYSLVNDLPLTDENNKQPSLASWISVTRGRIEIMPGQEEEIPISINIIHDAQSKKYYATIIFAQGSTRQEAEANALKFNQPELLLNIEVEEHIVEKVQIKKFQTSKNIFLSQSIKFFLELENIGNKEIKPKGAIHIYDRKGQEVGVIDLPETNIKPLNFEVLTKDWSIEKGFGKFKAQLLVEYGSKEKKDVQDIIYFWILPWYLLLLFIFIFLILFIFLLIIIFRKFKKNQFKPPAEEKLLDLRIKR